jgi:hypothetical protein
MDFENTNLENSNDVVVVDETVTTENNSDTSEADIAYLTYNFDNDYPEVEENVTTTDESELVAEVTSEDVSE